MNTINKYQSLIIFAAVALGLLLGRLSYIAEFAGYLIVPFLMIMLFGLFLNIPIKALVKSFANVKFFSANIIINFIWTPLFAYFLACLFLKNELNLSIGLIMLLVTPCTDWYLIFTGIAKGNLTLSTSILPINLILQIVLLPVYLYLFFGTSGSIDLGLLCESVALVLILPFTLAQMLKAFLLKTKKREKLGVEILSFFEKAQLLFLSLAITAMFASQGNYLIDNIQLTLMLLLPLIAFFVTNFFVTLAVGKILKFNYEDTVSLNLTCLARNSPIALAIAVTAFPNEPLIALTLVIAPLIELPVLSLVSQILIKTRQSKV